MKKIALLAVMTLSAAVTFAGGIDNKGNLSTGYLRNPSRNSENKRPEAVFYNEAGTGFMTDGLYIEAGNQFVFKEYTNSAVGKTYTENTSVFLYPNADIVWKKGNLSLFGGFSIFGGGGELDYKDGTAATASMLNSKLGITSDHSVNVYSVTFGEILGVSYKFNDMFSLSAAGRILEGNQKLTLTCSALTAAGNGGSEIGYDATGIGFGGIFGVHVKPVAKLDLSAQYQTITKLDMKYNSMTGNLTPILLKAKEGDTFANDMPAVLNIGAAYQIIEPLNISASFNYYFNEQADMDNVLNATSYDYDNSWEAGAGLDWTINNQFNASTGAMYSKQGNNDTSNNTLSPILDSITIGTGAECKVYKDILTVTAGVLYTKYFEEEYSSITLNKKIIMFSLGATYKPF
jgi:long-chain fatty acid transport protein